MTTSDSALNALSASLTAADSPLAANLAEILTDAIQELIEAELTARIGAEPGERSLARTNLRNGHRDKLVSTPAGDITVGIPKLRQGSFFPELLEPRRRIDKALWAVIMTAYITGTSTRKVDDLVKALGCDTGISKSSVSAGSANTRRRCRRATQPGSRPPAVRVPVARRHLRARPRRRPGHLQSRRDRHRAASRRLPRSPRCRCRRLRERNVLDRVPPRPQGPQPRAVCAS